MDSSDEEVLFETCCLVVILRSKSKEKEKGRWFEKSIKKNRNQELTIIYCRRWLSMIENRISGYLHNKLFSEINEEKCTISQSMAWSLIVHINTDRNCSTALQAFSFRSISFRVHNLGCNVKGQGSGTPGPPARYAPAVNRCLFLAKNLSPLFRKR